MNRKKILLTNISKSFIYKSLNMAIVFITIPLLLNFLEKELYGIWVTIFSLVNIVLFVDGGISNGLKTKLAEAFSLKKNILAKNYISTSYICLFCIAFLFLIIILPIIFYIDFQLVFNTSLMSNNDLRNVILLTLFLISISFVLNLFKSFYYANQQASSVELALLVYQILVLFGLVLIFNYFSKKLIFIALIYGLSNIIVAFFFTFLFFKRNKNLKPSIKFFKKSEVKNLMGLSLEFFVIQLCMIIIFTTDNLLISNLINPEEVAKYDVVFKLYQVIITLSVIALDPFWALFSDAYQKKDFVWIRKTLRRLNLIFLIFSFFMVIFYFISDDILKIWLQRNLEINKTLFLFMFFYVLVRVYPIVFMFFLNGIGKVKLQMWLFILGAFMNIPLSIFFVKKISLGSSGVILGTVCSIILLSIILPIQSYKIIRKNEVN